MLRPVSCVLPWISVATVFSWSRQCFLGRDSDVELLLQIGVTTQLFLSRQHFFLFIVATLSYIIVISVATKKICRDRVLSPLSLFLYCSFIFDVAT